MTHARVALCEDHAIVREGFRQLINSLRGYRVEREFGSVAEVVADGALDGIDLLILDLSLPDGNGMDVLDILHVRKVAPLVLVLSMHDAPAFVHDALARGAAGFLSKRAAAEALPDALAAVARGERYTGDNKQPALREDPLATLTPREHAVLLQTVMGRRPAEIGEALGVHVKTVYAHRLSLMTKLSARNPMDLYRIARQHGLIS
ncbi:MAG: DNA-binding response regulator [Gammaproteobacteria bacterium HGW-Gammaproteobacteria-5]|nr:MAG: DNA-binding response regulator [Gammaproteobacteria bacterium HGW-Gammaproteobacteria-5]